MRGSLLERYERQATLLRPRHPLDDVLELRDRETPSWKPRLAELIRARELCAMDGAYYHDTRLPFSTAAFPTITLGTTSLMLWPSGGSPSATPAGYWTGGKKMRLDIFGTLTTAGTPGNLTAEIRYGTADNAGTILATSAAQTLVASQTTIPWYLHAEVHSRADVIGTSKPLFAWGLFHVGTAVIAVGQFFLPASAPAATNVDLSAASAINVQFKRSGSTAETATVQDLIVSSLN